MLLKIPIKLVSEANSSEHWTKKSKRHKIQKLLIRSYLMREKIPPLPICVTLIRYAPRPFDSDNLQSAFKYARDAISEFVTGCNQAGMADSDPRIKWVYKQEKTTEKEHFILIEILSDFPSEEINEQFIANHYYT